MREGDLFQHRRTGDLVRIEVLLGGLLSFSILVQGHWVMHQDLWDVKQFRKKFRPVYLPPPPKLPS